MTSGVWKQTPKTSGRIVAKLIQSASRKRRLDAEPDVELQQEAQRDRQDPEEAEEHARRGTARARTAGTS